MTQNPYSAPRSDIGSGDDPQRRGSGVRAVAIGVAVDIGGTMVSGALIGTLLAVAMADPSDPESFQRMTKAPGFVLVSMALGSAFTVLGGYVAARIANHSEYRYALLVGAWSLAFGILTTLWSSDLSPGETIAGLALTLPCALAGGYLRAATKPRR